MGDAEDDYMSAAILEQAEKFDRPKKGKRDGLEWIRKKNKRKRDAEERQLRSQPLKKKVREQLALEAMEEGMKTQLSEDNKGFQLLAKMGYKKGEGLGKGDRKGVIAPVTVELRQGRGGLGVEEEKRQRMQEKQKQRETHLKALVAMAETLQQDFRSRMRLKYLDQKVTGQLKRGFQTCIELDKKQGITASNSPWLKEFEVREAEEERLRLERMETYVSDFDETGRELVEQKLLEPAPSLMDKLTRNEALLAYLRDTHYYCLYCGEAYTSEEELDNLCPGMTEDDHE